MAGWGDDVLDSFDDRVLGDAGWAAGSEGFGDGNDGSDIEGGDEFFLSCRERVDEDGYLIEDCFGVLECGDEAGCEG